MPLNQNQRCSTTYEPSEPLGKHPRSEPRGEVPEDPSTSRSREEDTEEEVWTSAMLTHAAKALLNGSGWGRGMATEMLLED